MRTFKWTAAAGAAVFVVVVVAAYVVVSGYDLNKLKPEISKAVMEKTGRELTIDGDIDIKFGLSPLLTVSDVKLQGAPWSKEPHMLTIEALELKLKLLPLIFKRLQVKRLLVSNPVILVETNREGRSNLDFTPPVSPALKKSPESSDSDKAKEKDTSLPEISLDDLRIEGGSFSFKDGQTGREYTVELKDLKAVVPAMDKSVTLSLDGSFKEKPFALDGTFGPIKDLLTKDAEWPIKARASFDSIDIDLDGTATDILGERIASVIFTVKGRQLSDLEILTGEEVPLSGPFEFTGRAVTPNPHTYTLTDLKGKLDGSDISGVVTAEIGRSGGRPPKLKAVLSSDKLDLRPLLKKDASATSTGKDAPASKPLTKKERKKQKKRKGRVFPNEPLGFELLKLVDGEIDFKAGQVLLKKLAFTDLDVAIKLDGGKLALDLLGGKVGGGDVNGSLMVDSSGPDTVKPPVVVRFKGEQIDVGRMLKELSVTENYKGKIDIDIDVSGNGRSIAEIMAKLNGRAYVSAGKGRIKSRYSAIFDGDLLTILADAENDEEVELGADNDDDRVAKINCLVLGLKAKDGLAETTALLFDTKKASVEASGTIKLHNEHIHLKFDVVPKDSLGAGGVGVGLAELIKPLKIKGTLARPKVTLDSGKAFTTLLKGLGGAVLLGPPGALLALTGDRHVEGENACVSAIEAAAGGAAK